MRSAIDPQVHRYAVLRFMPDPIREEFVNVGLVMVDEDGSFARFRREERLGPRLRLLGAERFRQPLYRFLDDMADQYDVAGDQLPRPLRPKPALDLEQLTEWAGRSNSMVRFSPIRVFLGSGRADGAFNELYDRLVRPVRERLPEAVEVREKEPERERRTLRESFLRELRRLPNFDLNRVQVGAPFQGLSVHHWVDVVVLGAPAPSAFAHALPFFAGDEREIYLHRGMTVEAAEDCPPETLRIAIHDDPPESRIDLLRETHELLASRDTTLIRRADVVKAAHQFDAKLIDVG